jgi:hypothetical protein
MDNLQKKKLSRFLICVVLIMSLFLLAACDNTDETLPPENIEWESLLDNGTFKDFSGSDAPYSPSGWTGTLGGNSDEYDSIQKELVHSGVVNTTTAEYDILRKSKWASNLYLPNPGTISGAPDPYVLMVYTGEGSQGGAAYYYSRSFSTTANKYYEISVDIYTQSGAKAYVRLRSSAWYSSGAIETGDKWQTYKFYIEAHQSSSKSVSIQLWNGLEKNLAFNAVFFDNVKVTEMKRADYNTAKANGGTSISLRLPNPNFDATSSTYNDSSKSPVSPNDYSQTAGTSKDASKASAPGSSSRISYGVVSSNYTNELFKENNGKPISETENFLKNPTPEFQNNSWLLLMLWNKDYTAYGYKSNSSSGIVMERGQYYKISVRVMTDNLSSIEYDERLFGDYYKAANGAYTKITSSAGLLGADGKEVGDSNPAAKSNGVLAVRANLPTKTNVTIPRYLDVIDENGNLIIQDEDTAARRIVAVLWSLKNNAPSSENRENLFITLESAVKWLDAAYLDIRNELYNTAGKGYYREASDGRRLYSYEVNSSGNPVDKDGTVTDFSNKENLVYIYEAVENGATVYYKFDFDGNPITDSEGKQLTITGNNSVSPLWKDSEDGSVGYAVAALLRDPDVTADKHYDKIYKEDGQFEDENGKYDLSGDFSITYKQFRTYFMAFSSFNQDKENANLNFSTDSRYYTSTSYKYGMSRYLQQAPTEITKGDTAPDGTPLGGNLKLTTSSISLEIKGIVTGGVWEEYSFYVRANQFQNTDFAISYNLGEGGAEDVDTHVKGFMFVDSLTLTTEKDFHEFTEFEVLTPDELADAQALAELKGDEYLERLEILKEVYTPERLEYIVHHLELKYDNVVKANGVTTIMNSAGKNYVIADIASDEDGNLLQNWDFEKPIADDDGNLIDGNGWIIQQPDEIDPDKAASYIHADDYTFDRVNSSAINEEGDEVGALLPYEMNSYGGKILTLTANEYGIFQIRPLYTPDGGSESARSVLNEKFGTIEILPLTYYRLSVWIKTSGIPETSEANVSVYLVGYTENKKNEGLYHERNDQDEIIKSYDRTELSSVTGVKTSDDADADYNGYTEVVFYIAGNRIYQDIKYVDLEITFGTGDYMSAKTLAKGSVSIAYPSLYKIAYKEYNAASTSGSYTKKYDFPTSSIPGENTFTNGEFDSIDVENTEIGDAGEIKKPSVPSSWTFQDGKSSVNANSLTKYDVLSGAVDLDNAYMIASIARISPLFRDALEAIAADPSNSLDPDNKSWYENDNLVDEYKNEIKKAAYEAVYGADNQRKTELVASNSLLMLSDVIKSDNNGVEEWVKSTVAYGYKSTSSKSLSANKYYRVSVMAMSLEGTPDAYIYLTSSSTSPSMIYGGPDGGQKTEYKLSNIGQDWKEYVFYIEVGQSSVSINLEFWLGGKDKKTADLSEGVVLFDNVRVDEIVETQTIGTKDYYASGTFEAVLDYIDNGKTSGHGYYNDEYSLFDKSYPIVAEWAYLANQDLNNGTATYTQDFIALTYMTDSFDSHGDNKSEYVTENEQFENEDEKKYLYSPTGWSGSLLTGSQAQVIAGVIDLESNVRNVLKDVNVTGDEQDPLKLYGGMGNFMLVIWNNSNDLAYTYTSGSKSFSSSSIYEVSVYVKTLDIAPDKNAYVYLTLGSTNLTFNVNSVKNSSSVENYDGYAVDEKTTFDQGILNDGAPTDDNGILNGYTKLTFYINNQMKSSISSVSLVFGLGVADEGLQGVVGIDNFSIKKFTGDETAFNTLRAKYEDAYKADGRTVDESDANKRQFDTVVFMSVPSDSVINPPVDPDPPVPTTPNIQWLIITSSVVGGATVVIVLIYFYRKRKAAVARFINEKIFKGKLTLFKASRSRHRGISPAVKEIRNEYDKYKED